jgi:hypothetical protein
MPERRRSPEEIKRSFENAKKVIAHQKKKEREVDVKWGIGALIVVGAFQLLIGLFYYSKWNILEPLLIDGGLGVGFIALSFYARKNAVQALTIGLISYIAVIVLASVLTSTSPFSGLLVKILVISTLLTAIKSAKKLPQKKPIDDELLDQLDEDI